MAFAVFDRASGSSRWLIAGVLVALGVEFALAATLHLSEVLRGHAGWRLDVAALGLFWLLVLGVLVWRLVWRFRNVDESLHDETERFAMAAAISGEWLWQASPELVLTYCSPATAEMLGYQPGELLGRSLFELMDPSEVARAQAIWSSALAHETGWEDVELWWLRADGEPVRLQGTALPVQDRHGRLIGYQGVRRRAGDGIASSRLRELRARIEQTLRDHSVSLALQPIVDLSSGDLFGVEALARFQDGRGPALWFADAHKVGKGVELELEAAARAMELFDRLPGRFRIGINASPALIVDDRFGRLLEREDVGQRISIEITEHAHVAEYHAINEALDPLRRRGVRVSIDDTGAGYASFSHVLQLKPDSIKIDRSWLSEIEHDPARRALCTAALLLAESLDALVIAEGVETTGQLAAITSLGITHAQGYLLARPSSDPDDWARWQQPWTQFRSAAGRARLEVA
jgi:PAS domain S-box-containing protein